MQDMQDELLDQVLSFSHQMKHVTVSQLPTFLLFQSLFHAYGVDWDSPPPGEHIATCCCSSSNWLSSFT